MSRSTRAMSARTCLRTALTCDALGGSPFSAALVRRPAPRGKLRTASGTSSIPAASSSEPPPTSTTSSRPLDQPNHRRTARKVSLDSSSPDSTCSSTPVSSRTRARTASPFGASRMALVAKARRSSTPLSSAIVRHSRVNATKASAPARSMEPSGSTYSASRSSILCDDSAKGWAPTYASTTRR